MASRLGERLADRLPVIGRLRRQRDRARRECERLRRLLSLVQERNGAMVVSRNSLRLLLDPDSMVDGVMFHSGAWEIELLTLMTATAKGIAADPRRKVFLDIGAYWGIYGLTMWQLGIFDEIHCFEPEPHNFAQLEAQLFLNKASYDIRAHAIAALDRPGKAHIRRSTQQPENRGGTALLQDGDAIEVPTAALDDIIDLSGAILFVKIDAEGSEPQILDGMQKLLSRNEVYLQVEVFPGSEGSLAGRIPKQLLPRGIKDWDHIFASFEVPVSILAEARGQ